jgi:hypothetical protein
MADGRPGPAADAGVRPTKVCGINLLDRPPLHVPENGERSRQKNANSQDHKIKGCVVG